MVVLVDGAAHRAQAVVAVGHGIGDGELRKAGGLGGLDDAHEGDVVGNQSVELQTHFRAITALVVGAQDRVGNGFLPSLVRGFCSGKILCPDDFPIY